jgi:hypothetical protein
MIGRTIGIPSPAAVNEEAIPSFLHGIMLAELGNYAPHSAKISFLGIMG